MRANSDPVRMKTTNQQIRLNKMAGAAGLEPVTSAVTGQRSNQLSYAPAHGQANLRNRSPNVKLNRAEKHWLGLRKPEC